MPFRTKKTDIWQYDIVVGGCRFRGSTGTPDWEEAKAVEARVRAGAKAQAARGTRYTLSEALGTYYRDRAQHQPSAATTASQAKALLSVMDGRKQVERITDADVLAFVAKQRATCSNATVNRRLQLLGRALRHMGKFYGATVPPLSLKAAEVKEPRERIRELSQDEQRRLFAHLPEDLKHTVQFALMTGARISTITGLLWTDIGPDEMTFRLKGGETMTFPISREMRAFLSAVPKSNVIEARRYVFTRLDKQTMERTRIVPNGGVFSAEFRQALADAEIRDFRFHDLRHTFATRMLRETRNIKLVSRLLGHKSIETTSRYAHVLVDDMRSALDGFSAFSGGVGQSFLRLRSSRFEDDRGSSA